MIGCSLGHLYSYFHYLVFDLSDPILPQTFAVLGATSVLAGATRMTYSLVALMMETSSRVQLLLPIIFTILISFGSSSFLIQKPIHLSALKSKDIPKANRKYRARQIMSRPAVCFHFIAKVDEVY